MPAVSVEILGILLLAAILIAGSALYFTKFNEILIGKLTNTSSEITARKISTTIGILGSSISPISYKLDLYSDYMIEIREGKELFIEKKAKDHKGYKALETLPFSCSNRRIEANKLKIEIERSSLGNVICRISALE